MVYHVGISVYSLFERSNIEAYDSTNKITSKFFTEHEDGNVYDKIESMFEKIKSKLNGELGCACVLLYHCKNKIRKKVIQSGLNIGFQNVEITDFHSAFYLNAILQINYKPKEGDIFWIFEGRCCRIWKKENEKTTFVNSLFGDFLEKEDFEKIQKDSKLEQQPTIIMFNFNFDRNFIRRLFPSSELYIYRNRNRDYGVLIKAQITAGIIEPVFDVKTILYWNLFLRHNNKVIMTITENESLPISRSVTLLLQENDKLTVTSLRIYEDIEHSFPNSKEFELRITIDKNRIFSFEAQ